MKSNDKNEEKITINNLKKKNRLYTKNNLLFILISITLLNNIYFTKKNPVIPKLRKKIKELELKIENIYNEGIHKKINIAIVNEHLYINGIGRFISVLSDLLVKTGKFNVFLMTEIATDYDFKYNKKIKRIVQKMDSQSAIDFDEANDIDIYIYNNEYSSTVDIYHSLGKKVIGIFHGVFLSCVFSNHTENYHAYKDYSNFDSFVHIIPDDYYIYKKFGFSHSIFIPNIYTFDYTNTPSSKLLFKNILMVGRVEDVIKGAKFGILAMAEILKEVPDAELTIIGANYPENLKNLTKELNIEKNVYWPGFSTNISEFYLNTSVLLVTSVTESFPMVMNEGKHMDSPLLLLILIIVLALIVV